MGGSNANVQFISSQKILFDPMSAKQMHFCISIALKREYTKNEMHFCSSSSAKATVPSQRSKHEEARWAASKS
ncbi:hypothetical protein [Paenibacillus sp. TH7-28]